MEISPVRWALAWPQEQLIYQGELFVAGAVAAGESQKSHLWDPPLTHQNKSSAGLTLLAWLRDYLSESDETLSPAVYHVAIGK